MNNSKIYFINKKNEQDYTLLNNFRTFGGNNPSSVFVGSSDIIRNNHLIEKFESISLCSYSGRQYKGKYVLDDAIIVFNKISNIRVSFEAYVQTRLPLPFDMFDSFFDRDQFFDSVFANLINKGIIEFEINAEGKVWSDNKLNMSKDDYEILTSYLKNNFYSMSKFNFDKNFVLRDKELLASKKIQAELNKIKLEEMEDDKIGFVYDKNKSIIDNYKQKQMLLKKFAEGEKFF